ncbi:hypothetical protein DsansV1_C06g0065731 [Dioscorea sansibarensis]
MECDIHPVLALAAHLLGAFTQQLPVHACRFHVMKMPLTNKHHKNFMHLEKQLFVFHSKLFGRHVRLFLPGTFSFLFCFVLFLLRKDAYIYYQD